MNKRYEVIVIFEPDLDDEAVKVQIAKVHDLVKAHGGAVESEEILGRQPLAYPMNKKTYGTYVLFVLNADGKFVADFNRQARISDEIIRAMVVSKDKFAPDYVHRKHEDRLPRDFQGQDGDDDRGRM